ncbi:MAG: ABC transporter permease, partial [Chloroflexota bacterium]|nr:ABC transporter permease [Chloroflexota bacterium]
MTVDMVIGASVLAATLRLAAPILLAALGGVISERAGVVNIALEGSMLVGAFVGIVAAEQTDSIVIGVAAAIIAGTLLAGIHAIAAIHWRSDQIVSGMALNILALGLTSYLNFQLYGTTGTPADVPDLPTVADQSILVWVSLALVPLTHLFLFGTVSGLRLRAVGE